MLKLKQSLSFTTQASVDKTLVKYIYKYIYKF